MVTGLRERRQLQDLFGRHVGEEVARRALQSGVSLGGELRQATILFVDVIGSTALAETRPAAEVVAALNRFFAVVVDCVEVEDGWVDKFEGDAALAVFGVPSHQDDHVGHGLRAARMLRAAVQGLDIDVGIGVTTGEVVAGNVGTERRHEFTVIGRPVNQAARLADAAKDYFERVLVTMDVVATAGAEACHWRPVGSVSLRGINEPVAVATLVGTAA
jgi:adenylate cyclase